MSFDEESNPPHLTAAAATAAASLPMEDEDNKPQSSRPARGKRSLAGKVKASVARPARAVGRRVFKNRYSSSKVQVGDAASHRNGNASGNLNPVLSRDISTKTPEDIFRDDPLGRDLRNLNINGGGGSHGNLLRRSLSRMMSAGSLSRTAGSHPNQGGTPSSPSLSRSAFGARPPLLTSGGEPPTAHRNDHSNGTDDWPVRSVEAMARKAVLLGGVYVLGASYPQYSVEVARGLEFLVTAWLTCLLILGLGWMKKNNHSAEQQQQHAQTAAPLESAFAAPPPYNDCQRQWQLQRHEYNPELMPLVVQQNSHDGHETSAYGTTTAAATSSTTLVNSESSIPNRTNPNGYSDPKLSLNTTTTNDNNNLAVDTEAVSSPEHGVHVFESASSADEVDTSFTQKQREQENHQTAEHPRLTSFYVVDSATGERVPCNSSTPYRISNEWLEMDMLVMIRTPDADDPEALRGSAYNDTVSEHFRGHARRFEFQYQVKLKKVPVGKMLYFSCELDEPVKMGIVTKAFVSAAMAFVRTTNPTFHYNITGSKKKTKDGKYENPHMSFTVEASLDRFVITKPGETPPQLGSEICEDPESIKQRKSGKLTDWNTEDTYTLALWSSYVDFLEWRVQKVPGIKPFGMASIFGTQPIQLTMYLIDADLDGDHHYRKDIEEVIKLELSNGDKVGLGKEAKKWIHQNGRQSQSQHQQQEQHKEETALVESLATDQPSTIGHSVSEDSMGVEESRRQHPSLLATADTMDENEMDDAAFDKELADAAELGEGIYLRSGDSVLLREFRSDDGETATACTVNNGGGFCVLSKRNVPIVIEKAGTSKRSKQNKLIKSGDTVMFKMIHDNNKETRYLTIHRGWWLKWVTTMPSKNGYFTIFTHETELGEHKNGNALLPTDETQSSFLTLGGSFSLRHKRWSRYAVGVSSEPSTDFGGRMLSLYNIHNNTNNSNSNSKPQEDGNLAATYPSDDDGDMADTAKDMPSIGQAGWIKPLMLCARDPQSLMLTSPKSPVKSPARFDENKVEPQTPSGHKLVFSSDHSRADVPAWIELLDREQRVRQLAYLVRIVHRTPDPQAANSSINSINNTNPYPHEETFARLKSGKNLARIMNIGQSLKIPHVVPPQKPVLGARGTSTVSTVHSSVSGSSSSAMFKSNSYPSLSSTQAIPGRNESCDVIEETTPKKNGSFSNLTGDEADDEGGGTPKQGLSRAYLGDLLDELLPSISAEEDELMTPTKDENENSMLDDGSIEGEEDDEEEDVEEEEEEEEEDGYVSESSTSSSSEASDAGRPKKNRLRKLKKLGKKTVVGTGQITKKTAKRTSKLAAKGLRGTGKATGKFIAPVARKTGKQPRKEPKKKNRDSKTGISKRNTGISKRKLKRLGKREAKSGGPPIFVAGALSATEQSRRTASRILDRMSSVPMQSSVWQRCNDVLTSELGFMTDRDSWFLDGDAMHLGVKPSKKHGKLLDESVVARCLWESHWREEWCGMYESSLSFYAPLARSACHEIFYSDITLVRPLVMDSFSPLPGFPILVIETAWQCHYMAFRDELSRNAFGEKVDGAVKSYKAKHKTDSLEAIELQKARFWQGFQTLSESSLASGNSKWAKVSSSQKLKERAILNGRRMAFDSSTMPFEGSISKAFEFVENLLTTALTFSFTTLEQDPESFIDFLNRTSELRFLPLGEIDLSSPYALCMFVNIYHCLLQQALLLSVNGPLHKKSIANFMRTSCYEIGGDVFSLAELHNCVICGKMSKLINPKPPYIDAPRKSNAYKYYALEYTDVRVHFVLNTADMACPASVPVLSHRILEKQLNVACVDFFCNRQLIVDTKRKNLTLPKVCEIRRNDFGMSEILNVLRLCLDEMDEVDAYLGSSIREVVEKRERGWAIKFQHTQEQYHSSLKLTTIAATTATNHSIELEYAESILESTSTDMGY